MKQMEKMKERINKKQACAQTQTQTQYKALTDEQLISVFEKDKKIKETKGKGKK